MAFVNKDEGKIVETVLPSSERPMVQWILNNFQVYYERELQFNEKLLV